MRILHPGLASSVPSLRRSARPPPCRCRSTTTAYRGQPSGVDPQSVQRGRHSFGKLFSRSVDDSVYALPLIVPDLDISGERHNVLFVASMGNTVYAFDADDPAQSAPLWSRNLGTPAPGDSWIGPVHHGILGTPFVDVPTGTLYMVAMVSKDNEYNLLVNALDIHNGRRNTTRHNSCRFHLPDGGDAHQRERRTPAGGAADGQRRALYCFRQHRARSKRSALVAGRVRADIQCARSEAASGGLPDDAERPEGRDLAGRPGDCGGRSGQYLSVHRRRQL